jgi:hypothetical protein
VARDLEDVVDLYISAIEMFAVTSANSRNTSISLIFRSPWPMTCYLASHNQSKSTLPGPLTESDARGRGWSSIYMAISVANRAVSTGNSTLVVVDHAR